MGVIGSGGRVFVVGGLTAGERLVEWLDVYTPAFNGWARLSAMPAARRRPNV